VTRIDKVLDQVLRGTSDSGIRFEELRSLLLHLGFAERSRGSHFIFTRAGVEERINLQREGSHAKAYQVKQARVVILKYHLAES
jgi:predicted RNA binding protein YcfA (HicA-like mRNA interferase family)